MAAAVSDITNGFNEIARQPILDSIAGIASIAYDGRRISPGSPLPYPCTPLAGIAPFVAGAYLKPAVARYSAPNNVHFIDVTAGVQQGDVFGSTLFCAGLHPLLCRLMDRHPRVICVAYADNVTFIGPLSLAWAALDEFNKLALEDLQLRINTSESLIHVPSWRTLDEAPALYHEVAARFPNTALQCHDNLQGFKFLGPPLGVDSFFSTPPWRPPSPTSPQNSRSTASSPTASSTTASSASALPPGWITYCAQQTPYLQHQPHAH